MKIGKQLIHHNLFMIGITILLFFLVASFLYSTILEKILPAPYKYLHNEKGDIMAQAPFQPSLEFPFGTDIVGNSLFYMVIDGAKYTILLCVLIGIARVILGLLFGFLLMLLPIRIKSMVKGFFDGLHFIPLSLYTFILIVPVFLFSWSFGEKSTIYAPLLVITLLSTPILAVYLADEIGQIYQKEFIKNAKIMGGSWWHIFNKHVRPFFFPKLIIVLLQQVGQVLVIFAHLGILGIFIGGGDRKEVGADIKTETPIFEVFSATNEWGGLIAKYFPIFFIRPYFVLIPVACVALTILALNFIVEGLKNVLIDENPKEVSFSKNVKKKGKSNTLKEPFTMLNKVKDLS
ncbi:ABC transporter permease subunit [Bacillus salitolerans]|uniref:ABC transporter permease subunit n=1 Tax=Bacillus salitolerans TaxID=1437434 RepID=A0ABW4LUC8_9BACI